MVSDDLSYDLLKKQFERVRKLYDDERKKTEELEKRIKEQEKQFTEQYERLLEIERDVTSGEGVVQTIEQEKIRALSRHLGQEHKMRLDAEDAKEKFREEYELKLAEERTEREKLSVDKEAEIESLKDKLKEYKDKLSKYEERELNAIIHTIKKPSSDLAGEESSNWVAETQDLIKVLHRWGSIKLDEAAQTLDLDREIVRSYAKILHEKGLVRVDDLKSPNPTIRATRDLVEKLNDLTLKMRRKGRLQ